MKKYFYIFCIIVLTFICVPLNVLGVDYKVCQYDFKTAPFSNTYTGTLSVSNGEIFMDYLGEDPIIGGPMQYRIKVVNTEGKDADPNFLTKRCPKTLCYNSIGIAKFYIDEDGCSTGTQTATLKKELSQGEIGSIEEAMLYQWGTGNKGKVDYKSIFEADGCPSDEPVFKLFKPVYQLIKIAAPVMLVLFATIDLAKAAAASDESMIKKAQKHCLKRVAAAVIVLLSFVSVEMIIKLVSGGSDVMACVSEFLK